MRIEMWPIDRPIDYPKNARKWSQAAIDKVTTSLREFGFRQPIVVDKHDVIIIGHLRRVAARAAGFTAVPVHVADLPAGKVRQLRLMDNRSHDEAQWDLDVLAEEMAELSKLDLDLSFTGFDEREYVSFMAGGGLTDPDEVPEAPVIPVTQAGDLWLMGDHRLLCDDSTIAEAVSRLLSPALGILSPSLMVTDPPYGVGYDPEWRNDAVQAGNGRGAPGGRAVGRVSNDDRSDWREAWALFPGDVVYVWHSAVHSTEAALSLLAQQFIIRAQIIWAKSHIAISRGHYHWQHEPCWYAVRKGKTAHWNGDRTQTTLWEIPKPQKSETGHSTQKPVECMQRPIVNHTSKGQAVYDPFLGSGTTLIACEMVGRICYAVELDPAYIDVGIIRWQNFTGKAATLDGDGRTFAEIAAERAA